MTLPTPPAAPVVPPAPPVPPPPPKVELTREQKIAAEAANNAAFFARGNQMFVASTNNDKVKPYLGAAMMSIMYQDGLGVFAQLAYAEGHDGPRFVFVPFALDNSTVFNRLPKGAYQYPVAEAGSPVTDLSDVPLCGAPVVSVREFYEPFADDLVRMAEEAVQKAEKAERDAAAAKAAPKPDYSVHFPAGTIFRADSTQDGRLSRYVGIPMQSLATEPHRVLAVPAEGYGLHEPSVWIPLDGPETNWSMNPEGTFRFANGVGAGNNVWNVETQSYVPYSAVVPYYQPPVIVTYDPWAVPVGVAAGIVLADALFNPYAGWGYGAYGYDPYWW